MLWNRSIQRLRHQSSTPNLGLPQEYKELEQNIKRLLVILEEASVTHHERPLTYQEPKIRLSTALWVPAIILYGFGDILTSQLVFHIGGAELNPLLAAIIDAVRGGIWTFALVKAGILGCLVLLSYFALGRYGWVVPALLSSVGGYLVVQNLLSFLRALM